MACERKGEFEHCDEIICCKCNVKLVKQLAYFNYLGRDFSYELPQCPMCGLVYVSEEIVSEKIDLVEQAMEGK